MYVKSLVLVFLLYRLGVQTQEYQGRYIRSGSEKKLSDVTDSFESLKKTFLNFVNTLEIRRRKIKKAFFTFIDEAFYDKKPKCSLRSSVNDDSSVVESQISAPELILYHGYHVETHTVLTSDGYMLSLHRILPPLNNSITSTHKIAILSHGLLGSSLDWILQGPKKALPYLLSDAGYDVWLTNFRGNKYSTAHVTKLRGSADFWNFSWHEIGLFDIPALIDYVRETTGDKSEINFIAYSMSGSALLVLLSTSLRYNAILKSATLIAPLVYMKNVKGPLQYLAELYVQYIHYNTVVNNESGNEFQIDGLFNKSNKNSGTNPWLFFGGLSKYISDTGLKARIYSNIPSGGSTRTILHYLQLVKSGRFQMFDMGELKNYEIYGSASPPSYQISEVKVPVILFNSINDSLSTVPGMSKLIFQIPGLMTHHVIKIPDFSHLDFIWAENAHELVYLPLIKVLQKL